MNRRLIAPPLAGIILVAAVFAPELRADIHHKQRQIVEPYYEYGAMNPAREQPLEMWIGKERAAVINARWTALIDFAKNKLTYLAHRARVYVETDLPLDPAALFGPDALALIKGRMTNQGTVRALGETKTVLDRPCSGFEVETWVESEGERGGDRRQTIWATTSVPVDLGLLEKTQRVQYVLSYFSDDLIKGYLTVKGMPMLRDMTLFNRGIEIKARVETLELSEQTPDPAVYSIPAGYAKKARLEAADIR